MEARVQQLEDENVGTSNMLYELSVDIDMLKERIKTLENLVIGDDKWPKTTQWNNWMHFYMMR